MPVAIPGSMRCMSLIIVYLTFGRVRGWEIEDALPQPARDINSYQHSNVLRLTHNNVIYGHVVRNNTTGFCGVLSKGLQAHVALIHALFE